MSQEKENNTNHNKPLVIRHSPPRVTVNRSHIPYNNKYFGNKSPTELLRMLTRLPRRPSPVQDIEVEPTPVNTVNQPLFPKLKEYHNSFAEFKKEYDNIPKLKLNEQPIRRLPQYNFVRKKHRHLDDVSSELSEFTINTNTNYSRLDIHRWRVPPPTPQAKQQLGEINDNDDSRSIATQDMLLDENDDGQVVLDSQQILDLKRKLEVDSHTQLTTSTQYIQSSTLREEVEYERQDNISIASSHRQRSIDNPPSIRSFEHAPSVTKKRKYKGKEKEAVAMDTVSAMITPDNDNSNNVNTITLENHDQESLNLGDDWGDDYGSVNDDINWPCYDINKQQNDTNNETAITNRIVKRIIPSASIPEPESSNSYKRPFGQQFVRDRFSNKLNFSTRLSTAVSYFDKVWDAYANQLEYDLKAYIDHRKDTEENSNVLLKDDIILLMKRQRVINDQTSLESAAYKYLPRESWNILCSSALKNNVLYPPIRDSVLPSTFDNDNNDSEEDEDDNTTIPDYYQRNIDFD